MASQIKQIGILKSIGSSQYKIFQIYLIMLVLMGLIAGIIGVPLAITTGKAFSYFVAGKLNFDILTTSVPLYVVILLMLASVLLPVLLSFFILLKGTGITVKEALSDYGIKQNIRSSKWNSLQNKRLSGIFLLAVRNTGRNSRRLIVTILAMSLGVAIFSTGFNVRQSLWNLLQGLKSELRYDIQVVINKPIPREDAIRPFLSLKNVDTVEMWVGGRGEIESKVASTEKGAGIVALPYQSKMLRLAIETGHWINSPNELQIVMNQQAMSLYENPEVGSIVTITIDGEILNAKLVGVARQFEKAKIYMDINQYDSQFNPNHYANSLMFVAKYGDYDQVIALKKNIEKAIKTSNLNILYVMSQAERVKIIYDHLNIILSTILILSFMVLLVSAVGMASATGINIWERTREIGVMRAIGAIPRKIYRLFVYEGFIVSVFSMVLGLILAYPLSKLAAIFFGELMLGKEAVLQYAFSYSGFWITLIVTIVFGWLASRIPAKSAIKIPAHKALSYE
ncbi:FtsX-like permease family protein [Mariniflexile sp. HMF6888]|uniref:ABC transporter permease n=1 Tax=Mariniflexile sp. HMF6888 TaxID=3373086 RepID=UPI0037A50D3B